MVTIVLRQKGLVPGGIGTQNGRLGYFHNEYHVKNETIN